MTVAEMIEELMRQPPDLVVARHTSDGLFLVDRVGPVMCYQSVDDPTYIHEDCMPEYPDDDPDRIRKEFLVVC
jgi:hypothetical protein